MIIPPTWSIPDSIRARLGQNSYGRQLAIAEGRTGNIGMAALALAEEAMLLGKYRVALGQAQRAERLLPVGSPPHLRVQDLQVQARREMAKQREQGGGQLP